jgi:hypothetical protein
MPVIPIMVQSVFDEVRGTAKGDRPNHMSVMKDFGAYRKICKTHRGSSHLYL